MTKEMKETDRQTNKQTVFMTKERKETDKQTNEQTDEQTNGFFDKRKRNKTDLSIRIISRKIINSKNKRIY
jgi:hypothetical protein